MYNYIFHYFSLYHSDWCQKERPRQLVNQVTPNAPMFLVVQCSTVNASRGAQKIRTPTPPKNRFMALSAECVVTNFFGVSASNFNPLYTNGTIIYMTSHQIGHKNI